LATGCANIQQMPSASAVAEDSSTVKSKPVTMDKAQEDLIGDLLPFLTSEQNFALEKPTSTENLVTFIVMKWKVPKALAIEIVQLADKYAYEDFPKRNDILAIISVESGFNPKASYHGSHGLMQIEKKSHLEKLKYRNIFDPEVNIELGSKILNEYYNLLDKNVRSALLAYNAGIGNFKKRRYRSVYYMKYKNQLALIPKD
jgi:hypothetical protein